MRPIPFNTPCVTDVERRHVNDALSSTKHAGDGNATKYCQEFFQTRYGFGKTLMTTSCTDALELCGLLLDLSPGDEVVLPSFTFVSSANAFALRRAKLVFADSGTGNPNVSAATIEPLINDRTRAIVVVHYAGVACDMDPILALAERHGVPVIEDAAQAVDSFYKGRALGGLGKFGAFSFHETKNISCGEGGLFITNDILAGKRAEVIREKGTNRSAFFRGEIDKYGWVEVGSSFLPSDILAAYLAGQIERLDEIQERRKSIWQRYYARLKKSEQFGISLPMVPDYASNNAHMFYLMCENIDQRSHLLSSLKREYIQATFHYLSLHSSPYFTELHDGRTLPESDRYTECLMRLPLHLAMDDNDVDRVADAVISALENR